MRFKHTEKGFSTVELLLIIVMVGLISGVGYFVYHSTKNTNKTYAGTTNSAANGGKGGGGNSNPHTGPAKTEVFLILEWKVSAAIPTPPEQAALIQYKIADGNPEGAQFTTQELVDLDKNNCSADSQPAGTIFRAKATDHFYLDDGSDSGKSVQQEIGSGVFKPFKKVGDYYYWYRHSQAACNDTATGVHLQSLAAQSVQAIVSKLTVE